MPTYIEKPRLVNANRGFSVFYNNRYLFSKYDPQKAFLTVVNNAKILDNSLIICVSPVLQFPIQIISDKLKYDGVQDCFILGIEKDSELFNFYNDNTDGAVGNSAIAHITNEYDIALLLENTNNSILYQGATLPPVSQFKRIIIFEASSESSAHREFYSKAIEYAQESISQFWKNRATLIKLGKLFSKNTIKNIRELENTPYFPHNSIEKPILVVGAGTSLDDLIPFIKENAQSFYILAIAAALRPLLDNDITPDAVVSVEAQYATERAFIGTKNKKITLFADLVSRPSILTILSGKKYFYVSEYTKSPLLERIKEKFSHLPIIPPLGSVGLTCTEIACMLRKNDFVPIFVCGLDFSYLPGKSHCNESPHIKYALQYSNKFSPFGNVGSAFSYGAKEIIGKNNQSIVTDKALKGYGDLFSQRYKNVQNIFDISHFGLHNDLPNPTLEEVKKMLIPFENREVLIPKTKCFTTTEISTCYKNEKDFLL